MGVSTQTVTPNIVRLRKLAVKNGAYVSITTREGAARAGMRKARGDRDRREPVESKLDVVRIVRHHRPGDTLDGRRARRRAEEPEGDLAISQALRATLMGRFRRGVLVC